MTQPVTTTAPRPVPALVLPAKPCDACGVPHAKSRFIAGQDSTLDLCGHHANKHRTQLILTGWREFALAQPEEVPAGVTA